MSISKQSRDRFVFLAAASLASLAVALTDGTKQPEFESFVPVDLQDMVKLSTGDLTYAVDLLEIPTSTGESFPLTLQYGAGVGPEQEASWAGLGWNINAGAVVRSVVNIPDDYRNQVKYKLTNTEQSSTHLFGNHTPYSGTRWMNSWGTGGASSSEMNMVQAPTVSLDLSFQVFGFGPTYHYDNGAKYNGNHDFHQYGFIYNNFMSGNPGEDPPFVTPSSYNALFHPTDKRTKEWDDVNANVVSDPLHVVTFPLPSGDVYQVNAYKLSGAIKAVRANKKTQSLSHSAFGGTNRNTTFHQGAFVNVKTYGGTHLSDDVAQDIYFGTLEDTKYIFADSKGGWHEPPRYYTLPGPPTDAPQPNKVFPKYGNAGSINGKLIGFTVVNADGYTYNFDRPAFVYSDYSEVSDNMGKIQTGAYSARFTPKAAGTTTGSLEALTAPLYAYQFLLSSVTGPDYVDKNADSNPGPGDAGYWVSLVYQRTSGDNPYVYRQPFTAKGTSAGFEHPNNGQELKYSVAYGSKDIYYLRNVITDKSIAIFDLFKREDGFESGNVQSGGTKGEDSYYGIRSISVFDRDDLANNGADGLFELSDIIAGRKPIKKVKLITDYALAKGTPNSNAPGGGKFTLKEVHIEGRNGARLPPYKFSYGFNPDYAPEKWDRWGFYKSDGAAAAADYMAYPNHSGVNEGDAAAWSLTGVTLPTRARIAVEYESDKYNHVHNRPIGSPMGNLLAYSRNEMRNENLINGKMMFLDGMGVADFPPGGDDYGFPIPAAKKNVYEIRNHAPGYAVPFDFNVESEEHDKYYNPFTTMKTPHFFKSNVVDEGNGGEIIRKARFWKNEIPQGMNMTNIKAYAYVAGWNTDECDAPVRFSIKIKGYNSQGVATLLNSSSAFSGVPTPQWRSSEASSINAADFAFYDVELWAQDPNGSCETGIRQRDMRVFVWDANSGAKPKEELSKLGGGIRVKSVSLTDPATGTVSLKRYFYDSQGDGTGVNTGVASKEPGLFNSANNDDRIIEDYGAANAIPSTQVFYGKVTVVNPDLSKQVFEHVTPLSAPVLFTRLDPDVPSTVKPAAYIPRLDICADDHRYFHWVARYMGSSWGLVKHRQVFKHDPVTATHKAVSDASMQYELRVALDEEVLVNQDFQELWSYTGGQPITSILNCLTETVLHEQYAPRLKKTTSIQDNLVSTTQYTYNAVNGEVATEKATGPLSEKERETVYAFETPGAANAQMGHKTAAGGGKNMLTQVSEVYEKFDANIADAVPGRYVGANTTVYMASSNTQIQKEGTFKWRANNAGTDAKPSFPWSAIPWSSNDPHWLKEGRVLAYDDFSHAVEFEDAVGVRTSAVFGYGNFLATGFIRDAVRRQASVYTGDYAEKGNAVWLDASNGWANSAGTSLSDNGHFGRKSIRVVNSEGPSKVVLFDPARPRSYTLSAWVQHISGQCEVHIDQRKAQDDDYKEIPGAVKFIRSITSGDRIWRYYEAKVGDLSQISAQAVGLKGYVGCPDGGEAYVDDIRFAPSDARVRTVFYDKDLQRAIALVDENNNPSFYDYDGMGALTGIRNKDGLIVSEQAGQKTYVKPAFALGPLKKYWDGKATECHELAISREGEPQKLGYEILEIVPSAYLNPSPDKKKVCVSGVDANGSAVAEVKIKVLETGEILQNMATIHGLVMMGEITDAQAIHCEPGGDTRDCRFDFVGFVNGIKAQGKAPYEYRVKFTFNDVDPHGPITPDAGPYGFFPSNCRKLAHLGFEYTYISPLEGDENDCREPAFPSVDWLSLQDHAIIPIQEGTFTGYNGGVHGPWDGVVNWTFMDEDIRKPSCGGVEPRYRCYTDGVYRFKMQFMVLPAAYANVGNHFYMPQSLNSNQNQTKITLKAFGYNPLP